MTSSNLLDVSTYHVFKSRLLQSQCSRCADLCENRNNIVVDRGNPEAKIMIVGEAPGAHEDRAGRAFVGRAGKVLDEVMKSIGLDTNRDVLIVNVVKCRPPQNRPPTANEARNCRPFLDEQINIVKPRVIVLLGATAAKHMIINNNDFQMKDYVGRFFEVKTYPGIHFFLLYHPAYILRDPRRKKDMLEHVKKLKDFLSLSAKCE